MHNVVNLAPRRNNSNALFSHNLFRNKNVLDLVGALSAIRPFSYTFTLTSLGLWATLGY